MRTGRSNGRSHARVRASKGQAALRVLWVATGCRTVFHFPHRAHSLAAAWGKRRSGNLALACPDCNAKKGPNVATVSSDGRIIELFNPRVHCWEHHFSRTGGKIVGVSEIGQATVQLLDMNEDERVIIRAQLHAEGLL